MDYYKRYNVVGSHITFSAITFPYILKSREEVCLYGEKHTASLMNLSLLIKNRKDFVLTPEKWLLDYSADRGFSCIDYENKDNNLKFCEIFTEKSHQSESLINEFTTYTWSVENFYNLFGALNPLLLSKLDEKIIKSQDRYNHSSTVLLFSIEDEFIREFSYFMRDYKYSTDIAEIFKFIEISFPAPLTSPDDIDSHISMPCLTLYFKTKKHREDFYNIFSDNTEVMISHE